MSATTAMLRDNPGLLVMVILLAIGTLVFALLGVLMSRSGASLRPIFFVGGLFALVVLPQFAFHLGVATGVVPRRNLTWMPAAEQSRVYGWVEQEAPLTVQDGRFTQLPALVGADFDAAAVTDLRQVDGLPFTAAQAACMVALPPEGSAIIARFAAPADAGHAAHEYARQAIGFWPESGADGLRTATRPVGDVVKLALVGRTLVIVSGADEKTTARRLHALGAIRPAAAPSDPGSEHYWLYRPGVLVGLCAALVALSVLVFFKGAVWAGAVPAARAEPQSEGELRQRLLSINSPHAPLVISVAGDGRRLIASWRFADARWLDMARVHQLRYEARVILDLDAGSRVVRVTEQMTRFDAGAGAGGAALRWQTLRGINFFHVEHGRVFGWQLGGDRPQPQADYAWRFNAQEMKAPLIDAVTRAGWQWRPTPWSGPEWLRWLTD